MYGVIRLLLNAGADINARDNEGNTALMLAADKNVPEILRLLLEHGADINAQDNSGRTALIHLAQYERHDARLAELTGRISDNIKFLVEAGADTTIQDKAGKTALMYEEQYGMPHRSILTVVHQDSGKRRIIYKNEGISYEEVKAKILENLTILAPSSRSQDVH